MDRTLPPAEAMAEGRGQWAHGNKNVQILGAVGSHIQITYGATTPSGTIFRPSYKPTLRAFAECHAQLVGREEEMSDLRRRVSAGGYVVVEGDSWAGKTALMTHLATALETDGWQVVRFYLVEGIDARAAAFLPAAIVQLLDLAGEGGGVASDRQGQAMQFSTLWQQALHRGKYPLALLVDGLDEQDPADRVSAHLPPYCPSSATIVVSTRPNPDLGEGLGAHHALASMPAHAIYPLAASQHALASERDAKRAINTYLRSSEPARQDLLGFLTVARDSLSGPELAELLDIAPGRCELLLEGIVRHLRIVHGNSSAARYTFGHVELNRQASQFFGGHGQERFVERILEWGRRYAAQRWPTTTPWYLVRSLDRLVIDTPTIQDRLPALLELATDERARLMRARLFHQRPFREAIETAIALLRKKEPVDLNDILRLVVIESDSRTAASTPPGIVLAALVLTGRADLAMEIATSITVSWKLEDALDKVAVAFAAYDPDRALDVARSIPWDVPRAKTVGNVTVALAEHDPDRALDVARSITDDWARARALGGIAVALAAHDPDRALDVARSITDNWRQAEALGRVALALRRPAVAEEALQVARGVFDNWERQDALGHAAVALTVHDADRALEVARSITDDSQRLSALGRVGASLGRLEVAGEALVAARLIVDDTKRADALSAIVAALVEHDPGRGLEVARSIAEDNGALLDLVATLVHHDPDRALDIARSITDHRRAEALAHVALALRRPEVADEALEAGGSNAYENRPPQGALSVIAVALVRFDPDRALEVARSITGEFRKASALGDLAVALAAHDADLALDVAGSITPAAVKARVLGRVAAALAESDPDRALAIARSITDFVPLAEALGRIAGVLGRVEVCEEALVAASSTTSEHLLKAALRLVAAALSPHQPEWALEVARSIPDHGTRAAQIGEAAAALAKRDPEWALKVARSIQDHWYGPWALGDVAAVIAEQYPDWALEVARSIDTDVIRERALGDVVPLLAEVDADQAIEVARSIVDDTTRASTLARVAAALKRPEVAQEAVVVARAIDHDDKGPQALGRVAVALAEHYPDLAIEAARSINDHEQRAETLASVATYLGKDALFDLADRWLSAV